MNIRPLRYFLVLLLVGCGLSCMTPAHAAGSITCTSASMTNVSFGTVNPLSSQTATTATLTYSCRNTDNSNTHSATVCFSIGEPGGAQTNPRLMSSGANKLQFQLYQDAGYATVWGSEFFGSFLTPLRVNMTLTKGATNNAQATLYAQVLGGQTTAAPGLTYTDAYQNGDTAVSVNDVQSSTAPGICGGTQVANLYFPFTVTASTQKNCSVTANNLSLGSVAAGAAATSGSSTMSVSCSSTTPYFVGLAPQNVASTTGAGTMKGTGANTNTVAYQLYSNAGLSTVWGNTATATSQGNGMAGSGNGSAQTLTVYAKVTGSTDVTPDNYSDIVQINVNY